MPIYNIWLTWHVDFNDPCDYQLSMQEGKQASPFKQVHPSFKQCHPCPALGKDLLLCSSSCYLCYPWNLLLCNSSCYLCYPWAFEVTACGPIKIQF